MASVKVFVEHWWYHVLVVIVRGEFRSATAQVQKEVAEEEGIEPSLERVKGLIDYVLQTEFGTRDLEFAWEEKQVVDEIQQEAILSGYTSRGIITVNEAREQLGVDPCQEPAAEVLDERMKAMVRDLPADWRVSGRISITCPVIFPPHWPARGLGKIGFNRRAESGHHRSKVWHRLQKAIEPAWTLIE